MNTDPMERMRKVTETIVRENAKLKAVDHNGVPLPDPPIDEPEPGGPTSRLPAPNPALGSSASGAPDYKQLLADAQKAQDWPTVFALLRSAVGGPPDAA